MSKRSVMLYLDDVIDSSQAIHSFIEGMSYEAFCQDRKTLSATIREFIVIGEAISKLMAILESSSLDYDWRMIKDFRNFIVHECFGVDERIIWDAACLELHVLESKIIALKTRLGDNNV